MKVVYLTQVFEFANDFGSDRHNFHCSRLSRDGHEVVVVTSNVDYKTGKPKHKSRRFAPVLIDHNGLKVYYVYSRTNFQHSYWKRIQYFISYFFFTLTIARRIGRADLVYAVSTPLTVGLLGYLLSRLLKARFVFEVTDVWPDVHIAMGFLKNRWLISFLRRLELFCYGKAKLVVGLSEGIVANIREKIKEKPDKVFLISNGVDPGLFKLDREVLLRAQLIRLEHGWEKQFVCMYLGAHGRYNSLETLVDLADYCRNKTNLRFVLAGEGAEKENLQNLVKSRQLNNFQFLPPVERQQAPAFLAAADTFLLPNLPGDFFRMNLQNKFFDYLASARPILFAGCGESARIIKNSSAGMVVAAADFQGMGESLLKLEKMTVGERKKMGQRGRDYVLKNFNRNDLADRFAEILQLSLEKC